MPKFQTQGDEEIYTRVCQICGKLWGTDGAATVQAISKIAALNAIGDSEDTNPFLEFLRQRADIQDLDIVKYAISLDFTNSAIYQTSGVHLDHLLQIQKLAPAHITRLRIVPTSEKLGVCFDLFSTSVIFRFSDNAVSDAALVATTANSSQTTAFVVSNFSNPGPLWGAFHSATCILSSTFKPGKSSKGLQPILYGILDKLVGTSTALEEEKAKKILETLPDEPVTTRKAKRNRAGTNKTLPETFNDEAGKPKYDSSASGNSDSENGYEAEEDTQEVKKPPTKLQKHT